jgi:2-hydroxychromene-2-carboxylate isomerase
MTAAIDFYFDFSSPYGYIMAERIDAVAARYGRIVRWRPILLGVVYKTTGGAALPTLPMKGPYSLHDIARTARFHGVQLTMPEPFPIATQHAARAFYWLHDGDCPMARTFAHTAYRAFFRDGRDISQPDVVVELASACGADGPALAQALQGEALKARLKDECAASIARGVFGSPYVIIDDEPFWGVDRLTQIERWLETGGF